MADQVRVPREARSLAVAVLFVAVLFVAVLLLVAVLIVAVLAISVLRARGGAWNAKHGSNGELPFGRASVVSSRAESPGVVAQGQRFCA